MERYCATRPVPWCRMRAGSSRVAGRSPRTPIPAGAAACPSSSRRSGPARCATTGAAAWSRGWSRTVTCGPARSARARSASSACSRRSPMPACRSRSRWPRAMCARGPAYRADLLTRRIEKARTLARQLATKARRLPGGACRRNHCVLPRCRCLARRPQREQHHGRQWRHRLADRLRPRPPAQSAGIVAAGEPRAAAALAGQARPRSRRRVRAALLDAAAAGTPRAARRGRANGAPG